MKFNFWKMHGAQNDFVLFDNRDGKFPVSDRAFIAHVATRHLGIGSEGVILVEASESCDFRMRFYNPDGGAASMCGNGARCAARLAFELGIGEKNMSIETDAGPIRAEILSDGVCIWMTEPIDWRLKTALDVDRMHLSYSFVNTGVPHVVMRTDSAKDVDVCGLGSPVRYHRDFAPEGTNVNFVQILPDGGLSVRTYERGVEAETPACGTGVTACGLIAAKNGWVTLPVRVHTRSGDVLTIDGRLTADGAEAVTMTGPAEHVFEGQIEYQINE